MKILFTSPMMEYPPRSGPHLRIDNTIKALNQISDLHILSKIPKFLLGGQKAVEFYQKHSARFQFLPSVSGLSQHKIMRRLQKAFRTLYVNDAKTILQYAKDENIDVIWLGYGNISHPLISALKEHNATIPMICDTDSVWSQFIYRELPLVSSEKQKQKILKAAKAKEQEEKQWIDWCAMTTAVSHVDAEYYRQYTRYPHKVGIFPNAIDLNYYHTMEPPPPNFSKKAVLLSGSFGQSTSPMNRAADWVLEEIWPIVKTKVPDAHLYIVGTYSDVSYADFHDPSVSIMGRVPSMLPYLQHASCAITPLQYESGTRFKILEAAACHLPMVSTTLGAEGLDVHHQKHLLIADESEAFANAIVAVLDNPEMAKSLAAKSYDLVKQDYGLQALERYATKILEQVTSK